MKKIIKKTFIAVSNLASGNYTYDFSKVKEAFIFAGATDVVDTEDALGGFTCKLGKIPFCIKKYNSLSNSSQLGIWVGESKQYYIGLNEIVYARAIIVYKGTTGTAIKLYYNTNGVTDGQTLICIDNMFGNVYFNVRTESYIFKLCGLKDVDGITTRELKNISNTAGSIPGNITNDDYYTKNKITRQTWFNENLANAPASIITAIDSTPMPVGGIAMYDSEYYIYFGFVPSYNNSYGQGQYFNMYGAGVLFPLGDGF